MSKLKTPFFALATSVSTAIYLGGEQKVFKEWPYPLDLDEHARHLPVGVVLGAGVSVAAYKIGANTRNARRYGMAITATIGGLFETGLFDGIYRNTTHSFADAGWTALAGAVGAYCLKSSDSTQDPQTHTENL